MSMTPEDMRALSEARGRQITPPAPQTLDPNLVYEARGLYGDATYINQLVGGTGVGAGTLEQRQNALNILIEQVGKRKRKELKLLQSAQLLVVAIILRRPLLLRVQHQTNLKQSFDVTVLKGCLTL